MPDSVEPSHWFEKAKEQFGSAEILRPSYPLPCLVHLQQTAEMLLKGKLLELGIRPTLTHSIDNLQKTLRQQGLVFTGLSDPALLDTAYLEARYPVPQYLAPPVDGIDLILAEVRQLGQELAPSHFAPQQILGITPMPRKVPLSSDPRPLKRTLPPEFRCLTTRKTKGSVLDGLTAVSGNRGEKISPTPSASA